MRYFMIAAVVLAVAGCKKTRADYRDDVANAVCAASQECGKIGEGKDFSNMDDCLTEVKSYYNDKWPADACEGRIDPETFATCKAKAVTNACEGGVADRVKFAFQCGASNVCTAPADDAAKK